MSLELDNIVVSFGKKEVIHQFSCRIQQNSVAVLLGKSGSGKSTILKTIAGIIVPQKGRIFIDSMDITHLPSRDRKVGFVPQHQLLFPGLDVYENVAYGLKARGKPREFIRKRVQEISRIVGLEHLLERKPSTLSGGERQRVALARALAPEPNILLMDEPFSSLDEAERIRLALVFKQIQQEVGITTLHVTHSSTETDLLANKVIVLEDGRVMQEGTFADIRFSPKTLSIAQLVGLPNIFDHLPNSMLKKWGFDEKLSTFYFIDPDGIMLQEDGIPAKIVSVTQGASYMLVDGVFLQGPPLPDLEEGTVVKVGYRKRN